MPKTQHYSQAKGKSIPLNLWDVLVLILLFGLMTAIVLGAQEMSRPYELGEQIPISLDPKMLPIYALHTVMRMGIALCFSLLFTFTVGTLAAKNPRAEKIVITCIDILQSVPILGFLSISLLAFMYLFPGSLLGPECAAIFAIFTSQVWNMTLSFYQSLKTVPKDLKEAAAMYHLGPWQKFWRLEVPFAVPGLLWNTMMSLSASWFFVVASEAISVANQSITLPGIGSYIMVAQQQSNYHAIVYVILTMLAVIVIYDQLLFRPLIVWSEKFKSDIDEHEEPGSWFLDMLQKSTMSNRLGKLFDYVTDLIITPRKPPKVKKDILTPKIQKALSWTAVTFLNMMLLLSIIGSSYLLVSFIHREITWHESLHVLYLGLITTIKVTILIILSSMIWVPVGVWIGLRPKLAARIQPVVQFIASFPANLVYPVLFMLIVNYHLNVTVWSSPLMILGTQWYILFNVIAGTLNIPMELRHAAQNYQVKGWLWWKKVIFPSIFPFYITGAMTAAGGCWNASIVADMVEWGGKTLQATGLGGYITEFTRVGDFPRIALGIAVMCIYVIIINRLVWQKLYQLSQERYNIG